MSYDVSIGDESFNYTSNVSALFYDHIPKEDSCGGLHELQGKTGKQAAEILGRAFQEMNRTRHNMWSEGSIGEPRMSAKYDAKNGWGSMIGAIIFMGQIMAACSANPRKKVHVSS